MTTNIKSYDDCYKTISRYATDLLPLFADGWSRFPQGEAAAKIVSALVGKVEIYKRIDPDIADDLIDTIKTIDYQADGGNNIKGGKINGAFLW